MNISRYPLVQQLATGDMPHWTHRFACDTQERFMWQSDSHYLEVEIHADGRAVWWYRNRETWQEWSHEQLADDEVPVAAMERLRLFEQVTV